MILVSVAARLGLVDAAVRLSRGNSHGAWIATHCLRGFGKRILRVELSRFLNGVIDPERRVDWQARRADRRGADRRRADRDELELRVFET